MTINQVGIVFLSLVSLLFIGIIDYITGSELSFSIFYLLPIISITWFLNRTWGIVLSATGAIIWIASDLYTHQAYSNFLVPYWNGFVRFSFFIIVTFLVSRVKTGWDMEKQVSRTDPLTGLRNMRSFYELADFQIERAIRNSSPFSLAYMDLDNFKAINDTRGHSIGDLLLKLVADIMISNLRRVDVAARLGGDEFIILLPEADENSAALVLDRIREKLLETMESKGWPVTFSIGLVTFNRAPESVREMIREADAILYDVKKSGKNRIAAKSV